MDKYNEIVKIIDEAKTEGDKDSDYYASGIAALFGVSALTRDNMPTIKFSPDAIDSCIFALNSLKGFTILGDFTNPGFPTDCVIIEANDKGLTVAETTEDGAANLSTTRLIGYDEIDSITVI